MPIAISLALAAQLLLGLPLWFWAARSRAVDLRAAGGALGIGVLAVYLAGLVGAPILAAAAVAASGGAAARFPASSPRDRLGALLAALLLAALACRVFAEPLSSWDARSIWFFQAKAVFHAGTALDERLWHAPFPAWAHPDYPKLLAVTAAAWAARFHLWNDVLPKGALVLLWAPAVCLALGFSRRWPLRLFVLTGLVLKAGEQLWNGEMDGLLAAYAGLALLYGARWADERADADLLAAAVCAALCAGLKNEGLVLAAIAAACTGGVAFATTRRRAGAADPGRGAGAAADTPAAAPPFPWRVILAAKLLVLPSLVWLVWRITHGVVSELAGGDVGARFASRLADADVRSAVFSGILRPKQVRANGWLFVAAAAAARFLAKKRGLRLPWRRLLPAPLAAAAYAFVLAAVYLSTPYDALWHLQTSASRSTQSLFALVFAGIATLASTFP